MTRAELMSFLTSIADVCRVMAREVEDAYKGDEKWEASALDIADMGDELGRLAEKMYEEERYK